MPGRRRGAGGPAPKTPPVPAARPGPASGLLQQQEGRPCGGRPPVLGGTSRKDVMADEARTAAEEANGATAGGVPLPAPDPGLLPPEGRDDPLPEWLYFDPEKWDAEAVNYLPANDEDPVAAGRGRLEGQGTAALFLSDLHLADGT